MSKKVSLKEVVDALDTLPQGWTAYVHRVRGEVYTVSNEEFREVEANSGTAIESESARALPDWQRDQLTTIHEIIVSTDWLTLPSRFEIDEWSMMDSFIDTVRAPEIRDELRSAIHGQGAFRRFKDVIYRRHLDGEWFDYKENALARIALEWLRENEIDFESDAGGSRSGTTPN